MKNEWTIFFDDEKAELSAAVPASLSRHNIPDASVSIAVQDKRADLFYQESGFDEYGVMILHIHAYAKVNILLKQNVAKTFCLTNIGDGLKMAVGTMEFQYVGPNQYNIFHTPEFSLAMNVYPDKAYQLFMIDIKDIRTLVRLQNVGKDVFGRYSNKN